MHQCPDVLWPFHPAVVILFEEKQVLAFKVIPLVKMLKHLFICSFIFLTCLIPISGVSYPSQIGQRQSTPWMSRQFKNVSHLIKFFNQNKKKQTGFQRGAGMEASLEHLRQWEDLSVLFIGSCDAVPEIWCFDNLAERQTSVVSPGEQGGSGVAAVGHCDSETNITAHLGADGLHLAEKHWRPPCRLDTFRH